MRAGERIVVAGASGTLGREVVAELKHRGYTVRALCRSRAAAQSLQSQADEFFLADALVSDSLYGLCNDTSTIVSCLGASVSTASSEHRSYLDVDVMANRHLLAEAKRAGVERFVYVSLFLQPAYEMTRYAQAHESVVKELASSGLAVSVIRPTGFHTAMLTFLAMARWGFLPLVGDGSARTNPISPFDLAVVIANALEKPGNYPVGGPEVLSCRQIGELVFAALGKHPRFVLVPAWILRLGAWSLRRLHPRLSDLLEFVSAVSVVDCVAPPLGQRTLGECFANIAAKRSAR